MSMNRMKRSIQKKWSIGVIVLVTMLTFSFVSVAVSEEVVKLTDISMSIKGNETLSGKLNDTFVFSVVYQNSSGFPPRYVDLSRDNRTNGIEYQGVQLSIGDENIPMKPVEGGKSFTEDDWRNGVRFRLEYKFERLGEYKVVFKAEDVEKNMGESEEYLITISRINEPPEIVKDSFGITSEKGKYTISIVVNDKDSASLDVYLQHGTRSLMNWNEDSRVYELSIEDLEPGRQEFTITATDGIEEVEKKFTVFILEGGIPPPIKLLIGALIIGVILMVFYAFNPRRKSYVPPQKPVEDARHTMISWDELNRLKSQVAESQAYRGKVQSLRSENETLLNKIETEKQNSRELRENIDRIKSRLHAMGSGSEVQELERIAQYLPDESLARLVSRFAEVLDRFATLELDTASRILRSAVEDYRHAITTPTDTERLIQSEARKSYDAALKELKIAHSALDVKILEFFLKKAKEFLEIGERASSGKKASYYEMSKKLSEEILNQLANPQLSARLRKLREVGYLDSLGLS